MISICAICINTSLPTVTSISYWMSFPLSYCQYEKISSEPLRVAQFLESEVVISMSLHTNRVQSLVLLFHMHFINLWILVLFFIPHTKHLLVRLVFRNSVGPVHLKRNLLPIYLSKIRWDMMKLPYDNIQSNPVWR